MKKHIHSEQDSKERYHSKQDYNKRSYRLEKNTYGEASDSAILRWMAERRYL